MRKKFLLLVLAMVCAVAFTFGLAACNKTDKAQSTPRITLDRQELQLSIGQTYTLVATISPNDGTKNITWESKNPSVATVDDNGKVTAVSRGHADVYAYIGDDKTKYDICYVTVLPPIENISLDQEKVDLFIIEGEEGAEEKKRAYLTATVMPEGIPVSVEWSSSDPSVATVGTEQDTLRACVEAVDEGEATVTASVGNKSARCLVRVRKPEPFNPNVTSIALDKTEIVSEVDFDEFVTVKVEAEQDVRINVTSSDDGVATAEYFYSNENGSTYTITCTAVGVATLTFNAGGKTATCKVTVNSAPTKVEGSAGLRYAQNINNTYSVTGIDSDTETNIVIGNYYEGKRVTEVAPNAFEYSKMVGITIPEGIYKIGAHAFRECDNLTSLSLPDTLTEIGKSAFGSVSSLTQLVVPDGVVSIADGAFGYCHRIESVTLGSGLKTLGKNTFDTGDGLKTITVSQDDPYFASAGGILYDKPITKIICVPKKLSGSISLSAGLTEIPARAFSDRKNITGVVIPDSVKAIGENAFSYCEKLTDLTLGSGVLAIGNGAFYDCPLTEVVLNDGVTTIGDRAFGNDVSFTRVVIPTSVVSIGQSAFGYNPRRIEYKGELGAWLAIEGVGYVLEGNGSRYDTAIYLNDTLLSGDVVIPEGVTEIGDNAFMNYKGITSITIPDSVTEIGQSAFYGSQIPTVNLGSGVTKIGQNAFKNCAWSVYIKDIDKFFAIQGLEYIKKGIDLYVNGQLLSGEFEIPQGTTAFSTQILEGLHNVNGLNVPASVTSIEFDGDVRLSSISVSENNTVYSALDGILYNKAMTQIILVPFLKASSISLPDSVVTIPLSAFSLCYELRTITVGENNAAFASVDGILYNKAKTQIVAIPYAFYADTLSLPEGLTEIPHGAFFDNDICNIIIPDSVKVIGERAFESCSYLSGVTLGNGVESIGERAFANCIELQKITLPDTVTSIAATAFNYCRLLEEIECSDKVDVSGLELDGCPNFKGKLVGSVYVFGTKLFGVAENAVSAVVPANITTVQTTFAQATSLKYVFLPESVTTIDPNAFEGCSNLTVFGVNLPDSITGVKATYSLNSGFCTADGWVYEIDKSYDQAVIRAYIGAGGEITMPDRLEDKAVAWCTSTELQPFLNRDDITKLTVTSRKLSVDGDTLFSMPNLTEIVLADTVGELFIHNPLFTDCESLQGISLAGGYANYTVSMKTAPTAEAVDVTPTDAANTLSHLKNSTYKQFTILKTAG